jgi:hypothetical protein
LKATPFGNPSVCRRISQ